MSTEYVDDSDLVEQARLGDTGAFGTLVERHRTVVYRTALAALGSHADAEDVAQEAFILGFERLVSFRGEASFKTWILRIAWHQALNRRSGVARRLRYLVSPDAHGWASEPVSPTRPAEDALAGRALIRRVRQLLVTLPRKWRDPLLLVAAGNTHAQVARMLDLPEGTVKWQVSEARRFLKRKLAAQRDADPPVSRERHHA